jgi:hypothetical protein
LFSKGNGLELLNKLEKQGKLKIKDTSVPKYLSSTGRLKDNPRISGIAKGGSAYFNANSRLILETYAPVVDGVYADRTGLFNGFSPMQAFAAAVMHEALHIGGDFPPEGAGPFAVEESLANSSLVVNTCFKNSGP